MHVSEAGFRQLASPGFLGEQHFPALGRNIRVLMVWPRIPKSFWATAEILPISALTPPLGLITVAALCPASWTIRLIDETVEEITDADIHDSDLVMVSGMYVQRSGMERILARARALGKRTMIGGPFASSDPDAVLPLADHVVVGEPDAEFHRIAAALEEGTAARLYVIKDKPDVTCTPVPRFDLLKMNAYANMPVQFSRGCPFECEFCDIITIYGRRPRTKAPAQLLRELDLLYELGWQRPVFLVDDNFIGNHKLALNLTREMGEWSRAHNYPFVFLTEASADLAQRPLLLQSMVEANFFAVFLGLETPSADALKETRKFQNLRADPIATVRLIQENGLWVLGGFIVGFDSDTTDIFEQQREFIERAAIPWAMLGFLQAMPLTALHQRLRKEGRLTEAEPTGNNFAPPNFRTVLPRAILVKGVADTLQSIYSPAEFYRRCLRSLEYWGTRETQKPPRPRLGEAIVIAFRCLWYQGLKSNYRKEWWNFLFTILRRWRSVPMKLWWGGVLLASADHFCRYAAQVVAQLNREAQNQVTDASQTTSESAICA
ncbi:MAG: B12-binding domain-containing radical SAM protein [Acidobacteriaceae bacterium]|nr:B12-binding domain-containing radical SAM protein [Acidobacteriaceae bacterium]